MPILDKEYFRYLPSNYPRNAHPDCYQFGWELGRVLPEFQAIYIVAGEGQFESKTAGGKKIKPGCVILLFPGEWHRYRPVPDVGWEEYWLSFAGRQIDDLVARRFFSPAEPVLDAGLDDSVLRPYLAAIDRCQSEPIGYEQFVAVNVMEVLSAVISAIRSRKTGRRAETVVRQARILLEQHAQKLVTMEQVAASFSMSEKHFRRIFKQQTGLSPYQYHLQVKIYRAKEMLRGTTLTVKEISSSLCFETPFHFSNAFKQRTGMSPSQWRSGGGVGR
jgi:AraC-like DNA-binding protein